MHALVPQFVCPNCPDDRPQPCLVLAWRAFLTGLEDLAEHEARALGEEYQRMSDAQVHLTALQAAAQGLRPRTTWGLL